MPYVGESVPDFVRRVKFARDTLQNVSHALLQKTQQMRDPVAYLTRVVLESWPTHAFWRHPLLRRLDSAHVRTPDQAGLVVAQLAAMEL